MNWLKAIEVELPPPPRCHHAITYAQYGSDETGWEDKLALQLNIGGKFFCFFLDDYDFEISVERFLSRLAFELEKPESSFQLGIGAGKYIP